MTKLISIIIHLYSPNKVEKTNIKNNLTNDRAAYYNNSHTALTTGIFSDEFVKPLANVTLGASKPNTD